MWSDAYKLTGDTYDPSAGRALMEELAGEAYTPVAQAPVQQLPWYRNLAQNLGGMLTKPNVIPAIAGAGSLAANLSGDRGGTPFQNFTKSVQNMAGGYGVGTNASPSNIAKSPVQSSAPSANPTSTAPQSPQVRVNITGSLRDFNNDGVVTAEEAARSKQPNMSNIKQMNTNFSPGGYDLPGTLGNPPTQSFYKGSGASTGSPESVLTNPVGNATPDERAYALALLAGNPDVGAPGVMKYALDSETQRVNERKAEAENLAAQASLQKASTETAKFLWEKSPAYIQRQEQIEYAKKMGDRKAELWLTRELQMEADKLEVTDPALRKIGDTYGDIMRKSGTTKIDGIISTVISAGARVTAANINAGATKDAASTLTAGQIASSINSENVILGQEKRAIMSDVRNREDSIMYAPNKEVKASIQAEIGKLKLRSVEIEEKMNNNSLALKSLRPESTPQKVASTKSSPKVGSEVTVEINGKKVKAKVVGSGVVEYNGKKYSIK